MIRSFRSLFETRSVAVTKKSSPSRFIPTLESLSERLLPATISVNPATVPTVTLIQTEPGTPTVELVNGVITINGTYGNDRAELSYVNGSYKVTVSTSLDETFTGTWTFKSYDVTAKAVSFRGFSGNDYFKHLESYMPSTRALRVAADGGSGNDTLIGSFKNDALDGGDGNDDLNGGHGDDAVNGQNGNDIIHGWVGNDVLDGGNGTDYLYGDSGNDLIVAGFDTYRNYAYGGYGDDTIRGGNFLDFLYGDDGNDAIDGGDFEDYIYGGAGNDTLSAGHDSNYNYLDGGAGNDTVFGGNGGDSMLGGKGNDFLFGRGGNDVMNGGKGFDVLYAGAGDDDLNGGGDDDRIDLLHGEAGADTFHVEYRESHWWEIFPASYSPQVVGGDEPQDLNFDEGDSVIEI